MKSAVIQSLTATVYPPQCAMCDARTAVDLALCPDCWRETPFIEGLACGKCGCPLPGDRTQDDDIEELCDDCMTIARPWSRGAAAMQYRGLGRKIVLSLKHGDRTELARAAAPWLNRAARGFWDRDAVLVPVPLHWKRLLRRRFNQSALMALHWSELAGNRFLPDVLRRRVATAPLEGHSRDQRFAALAGSIVPVPGKSDALCGQRVILIDDVMTSGATLAATAEACMGAGAADVSVVVLARVVKDT